MSGLENLQKRLEYNGGKQEGRMIKDKEKALKKALLYSYQACTAILADGREFRCLINPDKLKTSYDDKIISIPFKDIKVGMASSKSPVKPGTDAEKTSLGEEEIGMKAGDVFTWKETNSDWLVYLQHIEEDAYFRAEIRRCRYEIEINGKKYKVYAAGPTQNEIAWVTRRTAGSYNELNYDLTMYITKNDETEEFFHRFSKIKLNDKPWEVQNVDSISTEGIIQVKLKETFQNSTEEEVEEFDKQNETEENKDTSKPNTGMPIINGRTTLYPYDEATYTIENIRGGEWVVSNNKARIVDYTDTKVSIEVTTGRSGNFDLIYRRNNGEDIFLNINIESF